MSEIEKMKLQFNTSGDVMPPELFSSPNSKNWFAHITGRHETYKWNRQFLQQRYNPVRYKPEGFRLGEVYEFRASYFPDQDHKAEKGKKQSWQVEKKFAIKSKYSGFWKCVGIEPDGIRMERMFPGDLNLIFPRRGGVTEDDRQSSLSEFYGDDKEEYIL